MRDCGLPHIREYGELHGFGPVAWQKRAKRAPHPADRLRGFAAAVFIFSLNPRVFRLR